MTKDKTTLYGDESFKAEILKGSSDEIVSNALYVSPSGNDSNAGTASAPFKTVQKALDTVKAGQTIYLRAGTYTALNTFKSSGTEGNYITLRNYPCEKPYLTMTAGSSGAILHLDGNDYIRIEGLEIGGLSSDIAQGILLDGNENHVIIRNNDIHNLVTTKPGENDNGEANAILCYGEGKTEEDSINNICIENNLVHNNTTGWCESVSVTGNAKYVNIINNTVYDNTNIGIDFYGNAGYCSIPSLDQPRYCVAAGNVIYGSICGYAECAGLYVDGARDIVLENNISHDNMYGIEIGSEELQADYPVKNIIARNNLVYNNSAGGIRVGGYDRNKTGYVTATKIYNNTVVNNGEGEGGWNGELCFVKCDGVDVRNNIVYKDNKNYPMIGGDLAKEYVKNVTFSNNVFYNPLGAEEIYFEFAKGSAEGIAAFNAQTDGNDSFGKPDFNADYSLKSGSYGIDAGSDVSKDMGTLTDLANNSRIINTIDLGAFEYQDNSATVITTEATTAFTTEATTAFTTEATTEVTTAATTEAITEAASSDSFYSFDDDPAVTKDGTSGITYTVTPKAGTISDGLTAIACIVNGALFLNDASATDTVKVTLPLVEKTSGIVTYTAKITPSVLGTKWTMVQLNGTKADGVTEGEVLGVRTGTDKTAAYYGLRVNGTGEATASSTVATVANTQATLVINVDFDNDIATLSVDGSAPVTVTGVDAKSITSMSFQTSTGARDLTVDDAGIKTGAVTEPSSETTSEIQSEPTTAEPVPAGAVVHNFTTDGTTSTFFEIVGNLATDKGTVNYNNMTLTQCLKMETATTITFTAPTAGTLTLVFNKDNPKHNCKVDDKKLDSDANGIVTVDVAAGAHTISKRDSSNLYYISFVAK